jgi:predicted nicotinamide N-methyase
VSVLQTPRERDSAGIDNTGWCVWEASNLLLRYIADDDKLRRLLGATDGVPLQSFDRLRLLDLSAGAGLVSLACAAAGADVTATDVPAQLPQLRYNVAQAAARSGVGGRVAVAPLLWGDLEGLAALTSATHAPFDLVLASDILFIALRDKRTAELAATLRQLLLAANACPCVAFIFEERLPDEEEAFMRALAATDVEEDQRLDVQELALPPLAYEDSLQAAADAARTSGPGGHPDTNLWTPRLFWEPPPVRLFALRRRKPR